MPLAVVLSAAAAITWFGPVQVSFEAAFAGNPYDFQTNDVRVIFVAPDGHAEERLAFFDAGRWKAWLVTPHPADYVATLTHNGVTVNVPPQAASVRVDARLPTGFVRVREGRFVTDAGTPYFPLGHNLGWQQPESPTLVMQLRDMGLAGMNWTRIWACAFDEKNPFYSRKTPPPPPGELLATPLRQWDELIATAEEAGVRLQLVLFHHGLFSTTVNSNWDEHPWNAANGGFLERPQAFFTDPTAIDYTRRWLRHAVARWGHSPAIMAWELFNEVEWVDTVREDHDWETVVAWHADMAAFLRSLDPYHHLITTSSAMEHPALYAAMDYGQPHIYTRNLTVGIGGAEFAIEQPWFFGEFGGTTHGPAATDESTLVRDGLWASVLAGQPGAAGYWYWERVAQLHVASEFTRVARVLELTKFAERTGLKPVAVELAGTRPAPLVFEAGRGWGASQQSTFRLPADATPRRMARLSSYILGVDGARPDRTPQPLELHFDAPRDGAATISFGAIGGKGTTAQVLLDGVEIASMQRPRNEPGPTGAHSEHRELPVITVPYSSGPHTLVLRSTGPDWVRFNSIVIPDLGRTSEVRAIGDETFLLARITSTVDGVPATLDVHATGLHPGDYELQTVDLDSGAETRGTVTVADGALRGFKVMAQDVVVILAR